MTHKPTRRPSSPSAVCALLTLLAALFAVPASAVMIPTVPVGNAGNAGELSGAGAGGFGPDAIVGGVADEYRIGTYQVTKAQYVEFLNAVAATDTYGLYDSGMTSNPHGGITQLGSSGSFSYVLKTGMDNKPVNHVSWYEASVRPPPSQVRWSCRGPIAREPCNRISQGRNFSTNSRFFASGRGRFGTFCSADARASAPARPF